MSQMPNNGGGNSAKRGCGLAAAIGCGAMVGLPLLSTLLLSNMGGGFALLVIIGLIVFASRRANKKRAVTGTPAATAANPVIVIPAEPTVSAKKAAANETVVEPAAASLGGSAAVTSAGDRYMTSFCGHSFSAGDLQGKTKITCNCGNTYQVADLRELKRLTELQKQVTADLRAVQERIRTSLASGSKSQVAASQATASATVVAPAVISKPAKPVVPKVVKPKKQFSLQQWLIIGASLLVLVAGSVFVSTNIETMPQWQFELVTVGVALATGFGAFKARNMSILLANFLAAFSSSMQLATMSIIGDQISEDFIWSNMPAWFWAISLGVVSAIATVLAKFSKNFGFKGIALLGSGATLLVIAIGVLREPIAPEAFAYQLSFGAIASLLVLAHTRYVRSIGAPENQEKDKDLKAYLQDLAKREDTSLRIFGLIVSALQSIVGIGLTLLSLGAFVGIKPDAFSLLSLTVVAVIALLTKRFYDDQLSEKDQTLQKVFNAARGTGFTAFGLAAVMFASKIEMQLVNAIASALAVALLLVVAKFGKQLVPSQNLVTAGLFTSAVIWLLVGEVAHQESPELGTIATFVILFGLILATSDLLFGNQRYRWAAPVVHSLGVLILTVETVDKLGNDINSFGYALVAIALSLLAGLHLPIRGFIAKRQKTDTKNSLNWLAFGVSALVVLWMQLTGLNAEELFITNRLTLSFSFMAYSVVALSLATWSPVKAKYGKLLSAYSYLGQSVTVLSVLITSAGIEKAQAATVALLIACLTVINYVFGSINRNLIKMQLGYVTAIGAFFVYQWTLAGVSLTTLFAMQALAIIASTWLHTWLLRKRSHVTDRTLKLTPPLAVGAALLLTITMHSALWLSADTATLWFIVALNSALAIAATGVVELAKVRKVETRAKSLLITSMVYAGFGVVTNFYRTSDEVFEASRWRLIVTMLVLAAVVIRSYQHKAGTIKVIVAYLASITAFWAVGEIIRRALDTGLAPEPFSVSFAVALILTTLLVGRGWGRNRRILLIDVPIVSAALSSAIYGYTNVTVEGTGAWHTDYLRPILGFAVIAALSYWRILRIKTAGWIALGYVSTAVSTLTLACWMSAEVITNFNGYEIFTVPFVLGIVLTNLFVKRVVTKPSTLLMWDLPLLVVPVTSAIYGMPMAFGLANVPAHEWNDPAYGWQGYLRVLLGSLAIATLATVRTIGNKSKAWMAVGYLSSAFTALVAARYVSTHWFNNYDGPEIYTVLILASVYGFNLVARKASIKLSRVLAWDMPLIVVAVISSVGGFVVVHLPFATGISSYVREIAGFAAVAALSYLRINQIKTRGWIIGGYVSSALTAIMIADTIWLKALRDFQGVEVYSLLVTISVLVTHRFALKHLELKGTMFSWGLPIGTALLPSTLFTYNSLSTPFNELDALEISRIVAVLAVSIVLLVLGIRRGNLANSSMGIAGLTLLLIPNTAMHSNDVVEGSQIESTALVLGMLLFGTLALLRRSSKVSGNSMLFIGLPTIVVLAPALVKSLIALGNPDLTTVDWWRFGLVLAGSMTLLIVGSLRELAGMFYPGLISVLLSALPYGFKQTESSQWFLWVLLLLVAGVMVWIAVRLEKMKKAGRSSSSWLKELK